MTDNPRLDVKDRRIIEILERNGRAAHTQVAKEIGVSKQVAAYRIANLVDKGVISRFVTVVNSHKLGYISMNLLLKVHYSTKANEERFIDYLTKMAQVGWVASTIGKWDLVVSVFMKNPLEFTTWMDTVYGIFGELIQDYTFYIVTDMVACRVAPNPEQIISTTIRFGTWDRNRTFREIDKKILETLNKEPRATLVRIAERVNCRPETIRARMTELRQDGLLLGIHAKINPKALQKDWYLVIIQLEYGKQEERRKLSALLQTRQDTTIIVEAFGQECNLVCDVLVNDSSEIKELMRLCSTQFPSTIQGYHPLLIHEEFKSQFIPDILN